MSKYECYIVTLSIWCYLVTMYFGYVAINYNTITMMYIINLIVSITMIIIICNLPKLNIKYSAFVSSVLFLVSLVCVICEG